MAISMNESPGHGLQRNAVWATFPWLSWELVPEKIGVQSPPNPTPPSVGDEIQTQKGHMTSKGATRTRAKDFALRSYVPSQGCRTPGNSICRRQGDKNDTGRLGSHITADSEGSLRTGGGQITSAAHFQVCSFTLNIDPNKGTLISFGCPP